MPEIEEGRGKETAPKYYGWKSRGLRLTSRPSRHSLSSWPWDLPPRHPFLRLGLWRCSCARSGAFAFSFIHSYIHFFYCLIWFAIVISPFSFLFLFIPVFSPFFLMSLTHRLSLSKNQLLVLLISILLEGISVLFISSLIFIIFSFNWLWALFFFF